MVSFSCSQKSAKPQGSPLVGGPLALRPYRSREGAVWGSPGFFSRTLRALLGILAGGFEFSYSHKGKSRCCVLKVSRKSASRAWRVQLFVPCGSKQKCSRAFQGVPGFAWTCLGVPRRSRGYRRRRAVNMQEDVEPFRHPCQNSEPRCRSVALWPSLSRVRRTHHTFLEGGLESRPPFQGSSFLHIVLALRRRVRLFGLGARGSRKNTLSWLRISKRAKN